MFEEDFNRISENYFLRIIFIVMLSLSAIAGSLLWYKFNQTESTEEHREITKSKDRVGENADTVDIFVEHVSDRQEGNCKHNLSLKTSGKAEIKNPQLEGNTRNEEEGDVKKKNIKGPYQQEIKQRNRTKKKTDTESNNDNLLENKVEQNNKGVLREQTSVENVYKGFEVNSECLANAGVLNVPVDRPQICNECTNEVVGCSRDVNQNIKAVDVSSNNASRRQNKTENSSSSLPKLSQGRRGRGRKKNKKRQNWKGTIKEEINFNKVSEQRANPSVPNDTPDTATTPTTSSTTQTTTTTIIAVSTTTSCNPTTLAHWAGGLHEDIFRKSNELKESSFPNTSEYRNVKNRISSPPPLQDIKANKVKMRNKISYSNQMKRLKSEDKTSRGEFMNKPSKVSENVTMCVNNCSPCSPAGYDTSAVSERKDDGDHLHAPMEDRSLVSAAIRDCTPYTSPNATSTSPSYDGHTITLGLKGKFDIPDMTEGSPTNYETLTREFEQSKNVHVKNTRQVNSTEFDPEKLITSSIVLCYQNDVMPESSDDVSGQSLMEEVDINGSNAYQQHVISSSELLDGNLSILSNKPIIELNNSLQTISNEQIFKTHSKEKECTYLKNSIDNNVLNRESATYIFCEHHTKHDVNQPQTTCECLHEITTSHQRLTSCFDLQKNYVNTVTKDRDITLNEPNVKFQSDFSNAAVFQHLDTETRKSEDIRLHPQSINTKDEEKNVLRTETKGHFFVEMGQHLSNIFETDYFNDIPLDIVDTLGGKVIISEDGEYAIIDIEGKQKEYKIDKKRLRDSKDFSEKIKNSRDLVQLFNELENLAVVGSKFEKRNSLLERLTIDSATESSRQISQSFDLQNLVAVTPSNENLNNNEKEKNVLLNHVKDVRESESGKEENKLVGINNVSEGKNEEIELYAINNARENRSEESNLSAITLDNNAHSTSDSYACSYTYKPLPIGLQAQKVIGGEKCTKSQYLDTTDHFVSENVNVSNADVDTNKQTIKCDKVNKQDSLVECITEQKSTISYNKQSDLMNEQSMETDRKVSKSGIFFNKSKVLNDNNNCAKLDFVMKVDEDIESISEDITTIKLSSQSAADLCIYTHTQPQKSFTKEKEVVSSLSAKQNDDTGYKTKITPSVVIVYELDGGAGDDVIKSSLAKTYDYTRKRPSLIEECIDDESLSAIIHERTTSELLDDLKLILSNEENDITKSWENLLEIDNAKKESYSYRKTSDCDSDWKSSDCDSDLSVPPSPFEVCDLYCYEKTLAKHLLLPNIIEENVENLKNNRATAAGKRKLQAKYPKSLTTQSFFSFDDDENISQHDSTNSLPIELENKIPYYGGVRSKSLNSLDHLDEFAKFQSQRNSIMEDRKKKPTSAKIKETNLDLLIQVIRKNKESDDMLLSETDIQSVTNETGFESEDSISETDIDDVADANDFYPSSTMKTLTQETKSDSCGLNVEKHAGVKFCNMTEDTIEPTGDAVLASLTSRHITVRDTVERASSLNTQEKKTLTLFGNKKTNVQNAEKRASSEKPSVEKKVMSKEPPVGHQHVGADVSIEEELTCEESPVEHQHVHADVPIEEELPCEEPPVEHQHVDADVSIEEELTCEESPVEHQHVHADVPIEEELPCEEPPVEHQHVDADVPIEDKLPCEESPVEHQHVGADVTIENELPCEEPVVEHQHVHADVSIEEELTWEELPVVHQHVGTDVPIEVKLTCEEPPVEHQHVDSDVPIEDKLPCEESPVEHQHVHAAVSIEEELTCEESPVEHQHVGTDVTIEEELTCEESPVEHQHVHADVPIEDKLPCEESPVERQHVHADVSIEEELPCEEPPVEHQHVDADVSIEEELTCEEPPVEHQHVDSDVPIEDKLPCEESPVEHQHVHAAVSIEEELTCEESPVEHRHVDADVPIEVKITCEEPPVEHRHVGADVSIEEELPCEEPPVEHQHVDSDVSIEDKLPCEESPVEHQHVHADVSIEEELTCEELPVVHQHVGTDVPIEVKLTCEEPPVEHQHVGADVSIEEELTCEEPPVEHQHVDSDVSIEDKLPCEESPVEHQHVDADVPIEDKLPCEELPVVHQHVGADVSIEEELTCEESPVEHQHVGTDVTIEEELTCEESPVEHQDVHADVPIEDKLPCEESPVEHQHVDADVPIEDKLPCEELPVVHQHVGADVPIEEELTCEESPVVHQHVGTDVTIEEELTCEESPVEHQHVHADVPIEDKLPCEESPVEHQHVHADVSIEEELTCEESPVEHQHVGADVPIEEELTCEESPVVHQHVGADVSIEEELTCEEPPVEHQHVGADVTIENKLTCEELPVLHQHVGADVTIEEELTCEELAVVHQYVGADVTIENELPCEEPVVEHHHVHADVSIEEELTCEEPPVVQQFGRYSINDMVDEMSDCNNYFDYLEKDPLTTAGTRENGLYIEQLIVPMFVEDNNDVPDFDKVLDNVFDEYEYKYKIKEDNSRQFLKLFDREDRFFVQPHVFTTGRTKLLIEEGSIEERLEPTKELFCNLECLDLLLTSAEQNQQSRDKMFTNSGAEAQDFARYSIDEIYITSNRTEFNSPDSSVCSDLFENLEEDFDEEENIIPTIYLSASKENKFDLPTIEEEGQFGDLQSKVQIIKAGDNYTEEDYDYAANIDIQDQTVDGEIKEADIRIIHSARELPTYFVTNSLNSRISIRSTDTSVEHTKLDVGSLANLRDRNAMLQETKTSHEQILLSPEDALLLANNNDSDSDTSFAYVDGDFETTFETVKVATIARQLTPRPDGVKSAPVTPQSSRRFNETVEHRRLGKTDSWQYKSDYELSRKSLHLIQSIENDIFNDSENTFDEFDRNLEEILSVKTNLKRVNLQELYNCETEGLHKPEPFMFHADTHVSSPNFTSNFSNKYDLFVEKSNLTTSKSLNEVSRSVHSIFNGRNFETDIDEVDETELQDVLRSSTLSVKSDVYVTNVDDIMSSREDDLHRHHSRKFVVVSRTERRPLSMSFVDDKANTSLLSSSSSSIADHGSKRKRRKSTKPLVSPIKNDGLRSGIVTPETFTNENCVGYPPQESQSLEVNMNKNTENQHNCAGINSAAASDKQRETMLQFNSNLPVYNKEISCSREKMFVESSVVGDDPTKTSLPVLSSTSSMVNDSLNKEDRGVKIKESSIKNPTNIDKMGKLGRSSVSNCQSVKEGKKIDKRPTLHTKRDSWDVIGSSPEHVAEKNQNNIQVEQGFFKKTDSIDKIIMARHYSWDILDLKPDDEATMELFVTHYPSDELLGDINKRDSTDIGYLFEKYQRERDAIKRMNDNNAIDSMSDFSEISSVSETSSIYDGDSREDWYRDVSGIDEHLLCHESSLKFKDLSTFSSLHYLSESESKASSSYPLHKTLTSTVEVKDFPSPGKAIVPQVSEFNDEDLSTMVIAKAASAVRKRRRGGRNRVSASKEDLTSIKLELKAADSGISDSSNNLSPREQYSISNLEQTYFNQPSEELLSGLDRLSSISLKKGDSPTNLDVDLIKRGQMSQIVRQRQTSSKSSTSTLSPDVSHGRNASTTCHENVVHSTVAEPRRRNSRVISLPNLHADGNQEPLENETKDTTRRFASTSSLLSCDNSFDANLTSGDAGLIYPSIHLRSAKRSSKIYEDSETSDVDDSFITGHLSEIKVQNAERTVYCGYPSCSKVEVLIGNSHSKFVSCSSCFTCYCTRECRHEHWPEHQNICFYGRVSYHILALIRRCVKEDDFNSYLTKLAVENSQRIGRGYLFINFDTPSDVKLAVESKTVPSSASLMYISLPNLLLESQKNRHSRLLEQMVVDYDLEQEFVVNISVGINNNKNRSKSKIKKHSVVRCARITILNSVNFVHRDALSTYVIRGFTIPTNKTDNAIRDVEARRYYCRETSRALRRCGITLKNDYPEAYDKLCGYVEEERMFLPLILYGQKDGRNYKCILYPGRTYKSDEAYGEGVLV